MFRWLSLCLALALCLPPPAVYAASPCGAAYTVQRGDTLTRIARRCATTVAALTAANRLRNPNRIAVGQVLVIPNAAPAEARVTAFRVVPATFKPGDTIRLHWQVTGDRATVCPVSEAIPVADQCVSVPPGTGSLSWATDDRAIEYTGFQISVEAVGAADGRLAPVTVNCQGYRDWFFANAPARCPRTTPQTYQAAAERFERGRMIWLAEQGVYLIFIYGDAQQNQPFLQHFDPLVPIPGGGPDNRLGLTPPPGRLEPTSGFGLLWRGEVVGSERLHELLGWAIEPEFGYQARVQCEAGLAYSWSCYLELPEGGVINYGYQRFSGPFWRHP